MDYRREIDGLRALAVAAVILFHAGVAPFGGGFVGVDVFFVISGYLITTLILSERAAGRFSLAGFYERRARRILPALCVVLLSTIPLAWLSLPPDALAEFARSLMSAATYSSNVYFWRASRHAGEGFDLLPMIHTWSLGIEAQFYLLFPLGLLILWRLGKSGREAGALTAMAVASLALAQWGAHHAPAAAFFLLPTRGWELLIGGLVAFYGPQVAALPWLSRRLPREIGSGFGLVMIVYAVMTFGVRTPVPGLGILLPTLGAALILLCASPQTLVGRLLAAKPLVGLGLISYSAYLWHQPLFAFARHHSAGEAGTLLLAALAAASLGLAYLTWRYVEQPFRDSRRITISAFLPFAVGGTLAVLALAAMLAVAA